MLDTLFVTLPDATQLSKGTSMSESFINTVLIQEGPSDPAQLRAVFLAGSVDSTSVIREIAAGTGLRVLPSDFTKRFIALARNPQSTEQAAPLTGPYIRAGEIPYYARGRLSFLVDAFPWDRQTVMLTEKKLKALGYDTFMVFLATKGLDEAEVKDIKGYASVFGKKRLFVIDERIEKKTWTRVVGPKIREVSNKILRLPSRNPKGRRWLEVVS